MKQTLFECISLTFFIFLLHSGQTDDTNALSTPTVQRIKDTLANPAKRTTNFDQQSAGLDKRLRVGTGALAQIQRKKQQEANLFTNEMFGSNGNSSRVKAAKTTFNPDSAAALERRVKQAEVQVPEKPDSEDPADLKAHIALLKNLAEEQKAVSIFS